MAEVRYVIEEDQLVRLFHDRNETAWQILPGGRAIAERTKAYLNGRLRLGEKDVSDEVVEILIGQSSG